MNDQDLIRTVRAAFEWDGSWRDVYVLSVTMREWDVLWHWLEEADHPRRLTVDGVDVPWPDLPGALIERAREHGALLAVILGSATVHCHFFSAEEIEFDLDPREFGSDQAILTLARFLEGVGNAVRRDVLLTYENLREVPIVRYSPGVGFLGAE